MTASFRAILLTATLSTALSGCVRQVTFEPLFGAQSAESTDRPCYRMMPDAAKTWLRDKGYSTSDVHAPGVIQLRAWLGYQADVVQPYLGVCP